MIFDSTECEDDENDDYIAATLRPWVPGSFILDDNPSILDSTIYEVKIHMPSQSSFVDMHRYMRTPYSITKHHGIGTGLFEFNIPVLAFQSMDWIPRAMTMPYPYRHVLNCGESSLLHMRQMVFLFCERMRLHPNIMRFLETHENLCDLIHYPSRDEPERNQRQHIAFWYDRLFRMCADELAVAPLSEISAASSSDVVEEAAEAVEEVV